MSDIDIDALTREFFGQGMEPWRGQDWCEWAIDKDVAAAKERGLVAFVAARVEQDVRQQVETAAEQLLAEEPEGKTWTKWEIGRRDGIRELLSLARGGSDVG